LPLLRSAAITSARVAGGNDALGCPDRSSCVAPNYVRSIGMDRRTAIRARRKPKYVRSIGRNDCALWHDGPAPGGRSMSGLSAWTFEPRAGRRPRGPSKVCPVDRGLRSDSEIPSRCAFFPPLPLKWRGFQNTKYVRTIVG